MLRERVRGRLRNGVSYRDRRILQYLATTAVKCKVDSSKFLDLLMEAWNQEEKK